MLFNSDLLFIHVPKTGGTAVTNHLLQVLPRPIWYAYPNFRPDLAEKGITQIQGIRHETLAEARDVLISFGRELRQFQCIIAILRDPYAMEVSRFTYLQKGYPYDRGHNQDLALSGNFENFAIYSQNHCGETRPIQSYFLLDGQVPENLRILRAESLETELKDVLRSIGVHDAAPLRRYNESQHGEPSHYYTRAAEEAVYRRYQWVFDHGYYPRLSLDLIP